MTKCDYCGEFEAVIKIFNPNFDDDEHPFWEVCNDCDSVIREQQKLSFGIGLQDMDDDYSKKYGQKLVDEASENLNEIATRTGIPNLSVVIKKK